MDIGLTLNNRYSITGRIGKGGMGVVYRAADAQTGQEVAVKVLSGDLSPDPDMLERFRREGEALRQLRHPNIVGFVDMFQHEGQHVIVMEYVPGGSLHGLVKREGPLPLDRARRFALELCDALTRAHHLNIVHRDIKPENILIADDGTPKLTDFGLARLIGEGTRLTGTGTLLGTPYYMAPEAWEGRPLDAQADIWSLGVVLYEVLTGQVPFGGETLAAVMNKVLTAPLPDMAALRSDVPEGLAQIVGQMLVRDKARRYQSIREVAADLERGHPLLTPAPAPPASDLVTPIAAAAPAAAPPRGRMISPLTLGGIGVVATLLVAAGVIFGPRLWGGAPATGVPSPTQAATVDLAPTATVEAAPIAAPTSTPAPTRAATPTPGALPSATPLTAFQLAFADPFDDDRYAWRPQSFAFGTTEISGGRFVLKPNWEDPSNSIFDTNTNYKFDEFDLIVRGSVVENPGDLSNTAYGIIFGNQGTSDYYQLDWTPGGQYALFRREKSEWSTVIDWTFTGALEQGAGAQNEIRLALESGTLTIAFNGREVMRQTLANYQPGFLGLSCATFAAPGSTCAADEFIARWRQPQPVRVIAGCNCTQEIYEGQEITIRLAWGATTRKRAQDFIDAATPRVWIDDVLLLGGRQSDLAPFWQEPVEDTPGVWAANWIYPYGEMEPGTHVLRLEFILGEAITDGFDSNGDGALDTYGPGTLDWGTTEIVVVAPPE
jgi:predicted Ser/Thr protein kinase